MLEMILKDDDYTPLQKYFAWEKLKEITNEKEKR